MGTSPNWGRQLTYREAALDRCANDLLSPSRVNRQVTAKKYQAELRVRMPLGASGASGSSGLAVAFVSRTLTRIDGSYGFHGIGVFGTFVGTVLLDACEAQSEAAGVLRALLQIIEGDFHHQFGPHVHRVSVGGNLQLLQSLRLPRQHLIGETLEGLSQHDEIPSFRITRTEVEIAEPTLAPAVAPFGS